MRADGNTYFSSTSSLRGPIIIGGHIHDTFILDNAQPAKYRIALMEELKRSGFDTVLFVDELNMAHAADRHSFETLRGENRSGQAESGTSGRISAMGPLGRRRAVAGAAPQQEQDGSGRDLERYSLRQTFDQAWQQLIPLIRDSEKRIAIVVSLSLLQQHMTPTVLAAIQDCLGFKYRDHAQFIFLTDSRKVLETEMREGNGSWGIFYRTCLVPILHADNPEDNRFIRIGTPNQYEVRNFLNYARLNKNEPLRVNPKELVPLAKEIAGACARKDWGIDNLFIRLSEFRRRFPGRALSMESWQEFTDDVGYKTCMEQLEEMIGLKELKEEIRRQRLAKEEEFAGTAIDTGVSSRFAPHIGERRVKNYSLNFILEGAPGTGKTTIARVMAGIYYELGLLESPAILELQAKDLISPHVGETATLVHEWFEEAEGRLLFIDEAYELHSNSHGKEAVDALVGAMTTYIGENAVCLAGYRRQMEEFLSDRETNPGLRRRLPTTYVLPDYTPAELKEILFFMMKRDAASYRIGDDLMAKLDDFMECWYGSRTRDWGNAGEVETLIAKLKRDCLVRTAEENEARGLLLRPENPVYTITAADVPENLRYCLDSPASGLNDGMQRVNNLIGLRPVKRYLERTVRDMLLRGRSEEGMNFIFCGPPGTGKTTVAAIFAEILGLIGALPRKRRNLVKVNAGDLASGRIRLEDACDDAKNGCLFIDEAHQLADTHEGREILRRIVPIIEDPEYKGNTCFILAMYRSEMPRVFAVDSGLARRFPAHKRLPFNNYTPEELVAILAQKCEEQGITAEQAYLDRSLSVMRRYLEHPPANFGNGGFVKDLYLELSKTANAARICAEELGSEEAIPEPGRVTEEMRRKAAVMTEDDIPKDYLELAAPKGAFVRRNTDPYDKLDLLFGKERFKRWLNALRKRPVRPCHYAVAGMPGSGRRMAVRIAAEILEYLEILDTREVTVVSSGDLVAGYVGQTAGKTNAVIERAAGGTLLVLAPSQMLPKSGNDNSFGPDALGALAGAMGRTDLSIVFVDTPRGLSAVEAAMPDLNFKRTFEFEAPDAEMLGRIFDIRTRDTMHFDEELTAKLPLFFRNWQRGDGRTERNGRDLERLIEDITDSWNTADGVTVTETRQEEGHTWEVQLMHITEEIFPEEVRGCFGDTNREQVENELIPLPMIRTNPSSVMLESDRNAFYREAERGVVYLEVETGRGKGEGSGSIVTQDGYILTNAHVVRGAVSVRARIHTPGAVGGEYRFFPAKVVNVAEDCDLALIKLEGSNFPTVPLLSRAEMAERPIEKVAVVGYPMGSMLAGGSEGLNVSMFEGTIASYQVRGNIERGFLDCRGMHGSSGSPVFAGDGRCIGVFSGSIMPGGERNLDEMNYFYPISYFYERFVI